MIFLGRHILINSDPLTLTFNIANGGTFYYRLDSPFPSHFTAGFFELRRMSPIGQSTIRRVRGTFDHTYEIAIGVEVGFIVYLPFRRAGRSFVQQVAEFWYLPGG